MMLAHFIYKGYVSKLIVYQLLMYNKVNPKLPFPTVFFNHFNDNTHTCQKSITEMDEVIKFTIS